MKQFTEDGLLGHREGQRVDGGKETRSYQRTADLSRVHFRNPKPL